MPSFDAYMEPREQTSLVPLILQESKTEQLFQSLIHDFNLGSICDVSPGSGAAGQACLRAGVPYVACCRQAAHSQWLMNVLDKYSLVVCTGNQSPLLHQDLSKATHKYLAEIVEDERHSMVGQGYSEFCPKTWSSPREIGMRAS